MRSAISGAAPETAEPGRGKFYADLTHGLHAMAQPLTILRSAMEMLTLPDAAMIDQHRYLQISNRQVARTCGLFASLQDLIETHLIEAQRAPFDLWELLQPLIDDQSRVLESAGVGIAVRGTESRTTIRGDASRTENALAAVLKLAGSLSARGDVVKLKAMKTEGYVELTFENPRRHGRTIDSSDRLSLAVAEANILSQNGRWVIVEDPFRLSLALPIENSGGAVCEAKLSRTGLHTVEMNECFGHFQHSVNRALAL